MHAATSTNPDKPGQILRFLLLLSVLPLPALLTAQVALSPVPAWVNPVTPPEDTALPESEVTDGYQYECSDIQVDSVTKETWYRYRYRVVNQLGVQNHSELQFVWQPEYQTLHFHRLEVTRDGTTLPRHGDAMTKELQREQGLENGMYDGSRTTLVVLRDIRPGDVVEYAYTIKGSNPIFEGRTAVSLYGNSSYPIPYMYLRVLSDPARPLDLRLHNGMPEPVRDTAKVAGKTRDQYTWTFRSVPELTRDDQSPEWLDPWQSMDLSAWKDWGQVASWGERIFGMDVADPDRRNDAGNDQGTFPFLPGADARDRAHFRERMDSLLSPEEQAVLRTDMQSLYDGTPPPSGQTPAEVRERAARFAMDSLNLVQDRIRYFALEMGENSHRPRLPGEVLRLGYGDCKDKALLWVRMLREAGIRAWPALVHSWADPARNQRLPSPGVFNHAIALLELDGRDWWFDPTDSYQTGTLDTRFAPDYGSGLVLGRGKTDLSPMPPEREGTILLEETFDSLTFIDPADQRVSTTYMGSDADDMWRRIAGSGTAGISKDYLDYYRKVRSGTESDQALEWTMDRDAGTLVTTEKYRVSDFWPFKEGSSVRHLDLEPYLVTEKMRPYRTLKTNRTSPLAQEYPLHLIHTITVNLPDDWDAKPEEVDHTTDWYSFKSSTSLEGRKLELRYEFRTLTPEIPADKVAEASADMTRLLDTECGYWLTSDMNPPEASSGFMPSGLTPWYLPFLLACMILGYFVFRDILVPAIHRKDILALPPDTWLESLDTAPARAPGAVKALPVLLLIMGGLQAAILIQPGFMNLEDWKAITGEKEGYLALMLPLWVAYTALSLGSLPELHRMGKLETSLYPLLVRRMVLVRLIADLLALGFLALHGLDPAPSIQPFLAAETGFVAFVWVFLAILTRVAPRWEWHYLANHPRAQKRRALLRETRTAEETP